MTQTHPPRLARWLASRLLPGQHRQTILEDIDEAFRRTVRSEGTRAARRQYWLEVVRARPLAWRRQMAGRPPFRSPRRASWWASVAGDVRLGARAIRTRPGFASAVIVTFALGVGTTTAVFSVVDAVLLEALPYRDPEQLVAVWNRLENRGVERAVVTGPDLLDYRAGVPELSGIAGIWAGPSTLTGVERAERIIGAKVTENFFEVLGELPFMGRTFRPGEGSSMDFDPELRGGPGVVVLTHGYWTRRFGADPEVIGRTARLAGLPVTIVGVLRPDFILRFPPGYGIHRQVDLFEAFNSATVARHPRNARWLTLVARLAPGATIDHARASLDRVAADLRATFREHAEVGTHIGVAPFQKEVSRAAAPVLLLLLGAVGLVFIIACANVTNLHLVRALGRRDEMAIRIALGGSRARLIRQMVTENGVLGLVGGLAGVFIAVGSVDALHLVQPEALADFTDAGVDITVLGFALVMTALGAVISGAFPALFASTAPSNGLRHRSGTGSRHTGRVHASLVVAEVALSLVLLMASGVMVRALITLRHVDAGFDPQGVVTAEIALPDQKYAGATRLAFFQLLAERLQDLPGIEVASGADAVPLSPAVLSTRPYWLEQDDREGVSDRRAIYHGVLPGYFLAMGTELRSGRRFDGRDMQADTPRVAIIDETFAEHHWPGEDPLGKRFEIRQFDFATSTFSREWTEVVGVAEPARYEHLAVPARETIYLPLSSYLWSSEVTVVIRTAGSSAAIMDRVRADLAAIDPEIAVSDPVLLTEYVADDTAVLRFLIAIGAGFAALAVVLASIGLYGVIAYLVRERTVEIAIRMAFGADASKMTRMVLRRGIALGVVGVVLGSAGGIAITRVLANRILGVTGAEPWTLAITAVVLILVTVAATLIPARRAARVDPMVSLRTTN